MREFMDMLYNGALRIVVLLLLPRPRYIGRRGIVFDRFLCLYVSLFLSLFLC